MNRRVVTWSASAVVTGGALALAFIACGAGTHLYVARPYDPGRDCLLGTAAVDSVEGDNPGLNCARKCALSPAGQEYGAPPVAYISTMCPPYPPGFDLSGLVGACPAAIAAADRDDYCLDDGGSTHPAPPDASAPADTGAPDDANAADDAGAD